MKYKMQIDFIISNKTLAKEAYEDKNYSSRQSLGQLIRERFCYSESLTNEKLVVKFSYIYYLLKDKGQI